MDLTEGHALAEALAYHTSNKPLFGYAKRHRETDPKVQIELNIAPGYHAEETNEKGVQLCLWAGADPHAPARDLRRLRHEDEDEEGEHFVGLTPIWRACLRGNADILRRLNPNPEIDDFEELYRFARSAGVIDLLAERAPPQNVNVAELIQSHLWPLMTGAFGWRSTDTLERIFEVGAHWQEASAEQVTSVRRLLLKVEPAAFETVMKLFTLRDYCSREVLVELVRTSAMRARIQNVGFVPGPAGASPRHDHPRPTRSREVLAKCGIELPKPDPCIPRLVVIGGWKPNRQELRMDRPGLHEAIWSTPVAKLAEQWGLSSPGLAKACRRIKVPLPPRGYWAKLSAGKRVHCPKLPMLRAGEAEEVCIWVPAGSTGDVRSTLPSSRVDGAAPEPRAN